jgi:TRAP-type mannitol/chloroaromatic compound transport system substrate-binding protein
MTSQIGTSEPVKPRLARRALLRAGLAGAALGALPAPAIAQSQPTLRWRMPSSFGRNLDTLYGSAQVFISAVRDLTDGRFEIQWFAPGEIVPPLAIAQSVQNNVVELGQTASFYYVGLDPAFQLGSGLPFGMNVRGHAAWLVNGGGNELLDEFYKSYNIVGLFAGNTGAQAAGWFRKEIKSLADFRGLKMRIAGLAGQVFAAAGGVPQQIAVGEVYAALERGSIDGTKFTSPVDDEKLGFVKVAPYYYWPGWNDAGVAVHMFISRDRWNELPKSYQAALRAAAAQAGEFMQTKYDAENPKALRRIVSQGAQIRFLPNDVTEALSKSANQVWADLSAKNANFKRIYEPYASAVQDQYLWWQISELVYDSMMVRQMRRS